MDLDSYLKGAGDLVASSTFFFCGYAQMLAIGLTCFSNAESTL